MRHEHIDDHRDELPPNPNAIWLPLLFWSCCIGLFVYIVSR